MSLELWQVFVVFAVLLAVVMGFLLIDNPSEISEPTPSVYVSTSGSFQMYTNTTYGFTFQYPVDWKLPENSTRSAVSKFNIIIVPKNEKYLPDPVILTIAPTDYVERAFADLKENAIDFIVDGVKGTKYEYDSEGLKEITIAVPFRGDSLLLGANKAYEHVFNQILASFKFLK